LRWLAIVPLVAGLWILVFALIWTELGLFLLAAALIALAVLIWRAFAGTWPLAARTAHGTASVRHR
jgi:hypothetical protein